MIKIKKFKWSGLKWKKPNLKKFKLPKLKWKKLKLPKRNWSDATFKKVIISLSAVFLVLLVVATILNVKRPTKIGLRKNPYEQADFALQDGFMTYTAGESWKGIDVSHHQDVIDWQKVAESGVQFAMIRLGNRTLVKGELKEDTYGKENLESAQKAGLKVGVYFFSQAITPEEAVEEAEFLLKLLDGKKVQMPVVFDWEDCFEGSRAIGIDRETFNACAIAFCDRIRKAGYEPMVYFNPDLANRLLDLSQMQAKGYHLWLAMYRDKMNWPYAFDIWQYSESGTVPGISGPVDLDLYIVS